MIRRKVFSSYSEEDLISAIEERAFCEGYLAAQKEFNVLDDIYEEDYREDVRNRVRGAKVSGALGLGMVGAALGKRAGTAIGKDVKSRLIGAGIGAIAGGIGGYKLGKFTTKKDVAKMERDIKAYETLSPAEKKELRERQLREEARRQARENTNLQTAILALR